MTALPASRRFMLALALTAVLLTTSAARADDWWGPDKALHFSVSAALGASAYAGSTLASREPWQRASTATLVSLSFGAGKELWDLSGRGDPSWKDFTWDVAGTAVGVGLALALDALLDREPAQGTRRTQGALAFHF